MGYPQANQQTGFLGYPQNQLYNRADLQYMQDTQRNFLDYGNWQPGMTRTDQWMSGFPGYNDPGNFGMQGARDFQQNQLNEYYQRVGNPYEQAQRQGYWEQMGGQVYGGVIPPTDNPLVPVGQQAYERQANTPWGDLNNMGISSSYATPAWQQEAFRSQNATPGGNEIPAEQYSNMPFGNSNYGIPESFSPVVPNTTPNPLPSPVQNVPQGPEWMTPQQNSWGNNSSNPWGAPSGWGGRGWGR